MLQATEYQPRPYIQWVARTRDFSAVMRRRELDRTRAARALLRFIQVGMVVEIALGAWMAITGWLQLSVVFMALGLVILFLYPIVWAYLAVLPLVVGRLLIVRPRERRLIAESEGLFAAHPATKIAVAGSYGKTTVKELLATVIGEGRRVAATPANKNVAISHAQFARRLKGDEEVLIIEFGEGGPGDVARFSQTTHPNIGVVTGLAPAHLDQYKTMQAAGEDIFSLADYLHDKDVYVTGESEPLKPFIKPEHHTYSQEGVLDWRIKDIVVSLDGTTFTMTHGRTTLSLKSGLLGRHLVAPIALAAALAIKLGLTEKQVEEGISKTQPFEHRMQPRLVAGAWVIDDTYNGTIEGMRAGLRLLSELPATRKLYVTPGLVDQGSETEAVHKELGRLIAEAPPDVVVLMQNSVTHFIQEGLEAHGYEGTVHVEQDPLAFYTNLTHFTAAGDLVLMQNDWTDNYA